MLITDQMKFNKLQGLWTGIIKDSKTGSVRSSPTSGPLCLQFPPPEALFLPFAQLAQGFRLNVTSSKRPPLLILKRSIAALLSTSFLILISSCDYVFLFLFTCMPYAFPCNNSSRSAGPHFSYSHL